MTVETSKLIDACMLLRGSSPAEWENFVNQVRVYAAGMANELVRSPPDHLVRAQGMAQQAGDFANMLASAPSIYDKRSTINHGLSSHARSSTY